MCVQVPVDMLLRKADGMFPEGQGAPRPFAKDGAAADKTNELLENATGAVELLFKRRGYDPKKPEQVKANQLGYALDRYEAAAYLATGAMHLPLLSQPEAWVIGKRMSRTSSARAAQLARSSRRCASAASRPQHR